MVKRMIFYLPWKLNEVYPGASQQRPLRMLQAFKNIGYDVDIVMGNVKERRRQIEKIKYNIKKGVKYAFLYSESSTMPTALTEKHHLPIAPFLDFNFFKFCKRNLIKIGLFYRDIHWMFNHYKNQVLWWKRMIAVPFYKFDLKQYYKLVDILYLPSKGMFEYLPSSFKKKKIECLPPGADLQAHISTNKIYNRLKLIYVGGLGELYDLRLFLKVVSGFTKEIEVLLCTRKAGWEKEKGKYREYLSGRCHVVHLNSNELLKVYQEYHIGILFLSPIEYWKFAMPFKLFEYISFRKPVIATKGTAVGDFVEKYNIGWVTDYDESSLKHLICFLIKNKYEIECKIRNIERILPQHTWEARAHKVEKDLTK